MSTASVPNPFEAPQLPESEDRPRYIVGRWQEYQGEDYIWGLCWALWIEGARNVRVPRYHELIFLTALTTSGIIQGQVIRRVKSLAADYVRRLAFDGVPDQPASTPKVGSS